MDETGASGPEGNYDLQCVYPQGQQQRISSDLFESGVVSRVVGSVHGDGVEADVEGVGLLDMQFVPELGVANDLGERQLSLVAMDTTGEDSNGDNYPVYRHFPLGEVDEAGIVFPYPEVAAEDAEAVWGHAAGLLRSQEEGVIPDLDFDLLSIKNPGLLIILPLPRKE